MKTILNTFVALTFLVASSLTAQGLKSEVLTYSVKEKTAKVFIKDADILKLKKLSHKISIIENQLKRNQDTTHYIPQYRIQFLKDLSQKIQDEERNLK